MADGKETLYFTRFSMIGVQETTYFTWFPVVDGEETLYFARFPMFVPLLDVRKPCIFNRFSMVDG